MSMILGDNALSIQHSGPLRTGFSSLDAVLGPNWDQLS